MPKFIHRLTPILLMMAALLTPQALQAAPKFITVASTTSTQNSGLFDFILPKFRQDSGIEVRVVAVGTGQALRMGRMGDVDVLFVHDRASEEAFVSEGYGVRRYDVMFNDFVLVGPKADPAGIDGMKDAPKALAAIAKQRATFVSRGDDSGTNKAEKRLWKAAKVNPAEAENGTAWYLETGSGMGQCLNQASAIDGYTLSDRGTWLSFRNKGNLKILVEGDARLFNSYGVILVNPERFPHVKAAWGQALIDWLVSPEGQAAIAAYRIGDKPLFFPNVSGTP